MSILNSHTASLRNLHLAVVGLLAALSSGCAATVLPQQLACTYSEVSQPAVLPGISGPLRWPVLALGGAGRYVVGNDIAWFDSMAVPPRPLTVADFAHGSVGKPEGEFLFLHPRAVLGADGTLHVLWGEPSETTVRGVIAARESPEGSVVRAEYPFGIEYDDDNPALRPAPRTEIVRLRRTDYGRLQSFALWYAAHHPASGWTTPIEVHRGRGLDWEFRTAPLVTDEADRIHLALTDGVMGDGVVHFVREAERWHRRTIHVGRPLYSSVALAKGGKVFLAYVGSWIDDPPSSVYLIASRNGGASWGDPVTVHRSEDGPAFDVVAFTLADGTIRLVWYHGFEVGGSYTVLRHATSSDGGASWSQGEDLALPQPAAYVQSTVDRCGAIHVISLHPELPPDVIGVEAPTPEDFAWNVRYTRWAGAWTAPVRLNSNREALSPGLATTATGDIQLLWSEGDVIAPTARFPVMTAKVAVQSQGPRGWRRPAQFRSLARLVRGVLMPDEHP